MDIKWHRNPDLIPSIEEYTAMVRNKTGTLARLAVKTGILAGGGTDSEVEKAGQIAQDIGVGFQIIDDVKNLTTGNPGKKRGDDIVEGKKSLPVLLHLQSCPQDEKELAALFVQAREQGIESPAVEKAISILQQNGAVTLAEEKGRSLVIQKAEELAGLFGTTTKSGTLIKELFNKMLQREEFMPALIENASQLNMQAIQLASNGDYKEAIACFKKLFLQKKTIIFYGITLALLTATAEIF